MIVRLGRRYGFTASHRLYSAALTDEQNRATYGKCANPFGHGHNYEIELTLRGEVDPVTGMITDLFALDCLVAEQIFVPFGYKDLNSQVEAFRTCVPTTENLTREADRRLRAAWPDAFKPGHAVLEKVRIWETERNICEIAENI